MIRPVDYVTVVVSDLDASAKFYTGLLGLKATGHAHLEGEWIKAV